MFIKCWSSSENFAVLTYLPSKPLWGGYSYFHLIDKETEAQVLLLVTQQKAVGLQI